MSRSVIACLVFSVISLSSAAAQGLRVSTVVYDAAQLDTNGREPVLSRSFSLFHNGRVYDYVEAAEEVVIFEPAARRFSVLNHRCGVFTTVPFDEVKHLLQARGPRTDEYIRELETQQSTEAEKVVRILRFQLNPEFERQYNASTGLLTLHSPSWKYTVSTREWDNPGQLQQYIDYTDWAARLNCVLHPSGRFPEPRLALNEELRQLGQRVPVIVQLDLRPDERQVLRAEHSFVRDLSDSDRRLIRGWNEDLEGKSLKKVPFLSYQKAVLVTQRR